MLKNIDNAIYELCPDVDIKITKKNWQDLSDNELIFELVLSILGSQTSYEIAYAATMALKKEGLIISPKESFNIDLARSLELTLSKPVSYKKGKKQYKSKYRFYKTKAKYIYETYLRLTELNTTIKILLAEFNSSKEARKKLISIVKGFGPKQASHFLRNIGFALDIAILDVHILRYMKLNGLINSNVISVSTLTMYEKIENVLLDFVKKFNYPFYCVDQSIWIVMRVFSRDYVT